ncbi:DUF1850 domain-containing protein [Lentibacillus sp. CBA3610]|uniref:DUF1850 domain-containing protein n=1 Tax=Lentibacillus sp. CBA3610 TaxID=2518176 RepID=UPI00159515FD|nr:DUF1850 domain-containing protein [Lentibacillus sp. CBA3610]QKY70178.1 DUF1850 domain-containing protein [Lentibacillus sp. CBA3610]
MKNKVLLAIVIIGALFVIWYFFPKQTYLIFASPRSDEVYLHEQVETGDEIEIAWTHSVEHTPWIERFRVDEKGRLTLIETRFQSYGAGTPENTNGTLTVENGFIVITDLNETYETYNWIHSHDADYTVTIDHHKEIETTALPDQTPIEIKVKRLRFPPIFSTKGA